MTGGANGIGKAISELFAAEGAWVLVVDIEEESGQSAVREIRAPAARPILPWRCIFGRRRGARHSQAAQRNGRIDILCNNAAYLGEFTPSWSPPTKSGTSASMWR